MTKKEKEILEQRRKVALMAISDKIETVELLLEQLRITLDNLKFDYSRVMGQESFLCPKCGMRSYNYNDVKNKYCGSCHEYTGA